MTTAENESRSLAKNKMFPRMESQQAGDGEKRKEASLGDGHRVAHKYTARVHINQGQLACLPLLPGSRDTPALFFNVILFPCKAVSYRASGAQRETEG